MAEGIPVVGRGLGSGVGVPDGGGDRVGMGVLVGSEVVGAGDGERSMVIASNANCKPAGQGTCTA